MIEIIKLNKKNHREAVKKAADFIRGGKVVVFPTDTIYGFLCDAGNKKAVNKIFTIKNRDRNKPLPVFVKDIKMSDDLALINADQKKFLEKYWPGKVTLIFARKTSKKLYGIDKKTIALRIPKYKPLNDLLNSLGVPLSQTSVNVSGTEPMIDIKGVVNQFDKLQIKPDLLIDGGRLKHKSSKVVDLTVTPPKVLRK